MADSSSENLIKRQALKSLSGIFVGSHWSLYPSKCAYIVKDYDILFTWGKYFTENYFKKMDTNINMITGFCSDHYFKNYRRKAEILKESHHNKFVIGYMDNAFGHDFFEYSFESNKNYIICS